MGKKTCFLGGIISAFGYIGTWFGFTTAGIKAGSLAAFTQGLIGNVAPGSIFAMLTSWGMTGVFAFSSVFGLAIFSFGLITYFFGTEKKEPKNFWEKLSSTYNDSKEKTCWFISDTKNKSTPYLKKMKDKSSSFFSSLFK